nr:MAG TPA: hypothetical protein [Caudoviricetes sp.]
MISSFLLLFIFYLAIILYCSIYRYHIIYFRFVNCANCTKKMGA